MVRGFGFGLGVGVSLGVGLRPGVALGVALGIVGVGVGGTVGVGVVGVGAVGVGGTVGVGAVGWCGTLTTPTGVGATAVGPGAAACAGSVAVIGSLAGRCGSLVGALAAAREPALPCDVNVTPSPAAIATATMLPMTSARRHDRGGSTTPGPVPVISIAAAPRSVVDSGCGGSRTPDAEPAPDADPG